MTEYDNTNRGALFKNNKEGGNPNWPDYRGSLNVEGKEFWVDAWLKTIENGERKGQKMVSFKVKPKMAREQGAAKNPPAPKTQQSFDDSQGSPF
jgi:hypothetical protein